MITKIKNIKNVGRFKNFQGTNDNVAFKKNTFIFGKNTQGKSTLTAILKSLTTNNNDYIIGRKTFGGSEQNVIIEIDSDYVFNNFWDNNYKIKIFDADYISENIYSDDVITADKQEKIAGIILGEDGKRLEEKWLNAKNFINDNANRKKEISRIYSTAFDKFTIDFQIFLKTQKNEGIIEKIKEKEERLKSFSNQKKINFILQNIINEINKFSLNKNELEKTLELDQEIIENHFKNHLKTKEKAINFASSGLSIMKDEICPFCSQKIIDPATQLIEAYNILFSKNYKLIKKSVKNNIHFLNNWDFEKNILTYISMLSDLGLKLQMNPQIDSISENRKKFTKELIKKDGDLTYCIVFDFFEKISESLRLLNKNIKKLQEEYDDKISEEKFKVFTNELLKLEVQKKRYEKPWIELCNEYLRLVKNYEEILKPNEEIAFAKKNNYANTVLSDYKITINKILEKLDANFKLTDFSIPQNRIEEIKLFGLIFFNFKEEIPLINSNSGYHLKNTLSDSDKRLLAFAFFVVDIKNAKNLSEHIVVLDDPMSSFDVDRKRHTIKILRDELYNCDKDKPQQLIVLTHEPSFFIFLNEYFITDKKFLRIKYVTDDSTSKIIPCDIDEEFLKGEHYKKLEYYKKCSNGEIDNIDLSGVRIVLEEIIKMKFYIEIDKPVIDSGGVISWYKENKGNENLNKKIDDVSLNLSHHTQSNRISEQNHEESEKKDIVIDFLDLITKI